MTEDTVGVITGDGIAMAQMFAQRGALRLECLGMRRSSRPISVVIREQYGLTARNKRQLLADFNKLIDERKAAYEKAHTG